MRKNDKRAFAVRSLASAIALATVTTASTGWSQNQVNENKLEELVVTGYRASLQKANDLKRNASGIQDSIIAEDIGKFPDQNVAESLQRITGVTISRTNGVGDGVTIRGFGPRFNVVRLNGRTTATADNDRAFDFQVLPSEILAGADVFKSTSASTPEGSLGGYVNLKTAKPLNNPGFNATVSVGGRYEDQSESSDPRFVGVISNTFANDAFGVLLGISREEGSTRIDQFRGTRYGNANTPANLQGPVLFEDGTEAPEGFGIRRSERIEYISEAEDRERTSINGTLQWRPSPDWEITLDGLYVDLTRTQLGSGFQLPTQSANYRDVVVNENGTLVSATVFNNNIDTVFRSFGEDQSTFAVGLNAKWQVSDRFSLETDLSTSGAESSPDFSQNVPQITALPAAESEFSIVNSAALGTGDITSFTTNVNLNDPGSVRSHWSGTVNEEIEDEITEFRLGGKFETETSFVQSIQGGIEYQDRTKSRDLFDSFGRGCSPCGGTEDIDDALFVPNGVTGFLSGEAGTFQRDFLGITSVEEFEAGVLALRADLGIPDTPFVSTFNPSGSVANDEEIFSLFTQFNLGGEAEGLSWSGNVGFRYADTQITSRGFGQRTLAIELDPNSNPEEIRVNTVRSEAQDLREERSYSHFLPSANLSLDFQNGFVARGSVGQSITRPALGFIGVNRSVDGGAGTVSVSGGNPDLTPYEVTSYDASFEYYANNSDAYSVAFFHKDITNFISTITTTGVFNDPSVAVDPDLLALFPDGLRQVTTRNENREGGTVSGIELAALHHFDYLPGMLSNFGVQANYTYVDSQDDDAVPVGLVNVTDPGSSLEGLASDSYNLVGFYDDGRFQARLAYNRRDTFLLARQGNGGLPEHTDEFGQLDFSASYNLTDNTVLSLEAINLTDERLLQFADIRERVTVLQSTGRRFFLNARMSF